MGDPAFRVIAVDWSGRARRPERYIWRAEADRGALSLLEDGLNREDLADWIMSEAGRKSDLVVGFDFAFSFPLWFLRTHGITGAPALWDLVAADGNRWLSRCEPPFWGRPGRPRPNSPDHFRRTEMAGAQTIRPKSVFQVGGAGAVGTGSIRGMAILARLKRAGFSVWPFDPPRRPLVIEIWPRALTGDVVKSQQKHREQYLQVHWPALDPKYRVRAEQSEDAFDAAISALIMDKHRDELANLPAVSDEVDRLEGRIWVPSPVN